MAKEGFNWKSLFITQEDDQKKVVPETNHETTESTLSHFPNSTTVPPVSGSINPFMDEVLAVYEKGFDSLNLQEFDFFEIYKSVLVVGVSNPQSYQMAFTMGKSIKSDLTKEFLIEKSKFYVEEIEKVYQKFDSAGKSKRNDLEVSVTRDKVNLTKEISDLETQIQSLTQLLQTKKGQLAVIDSTNSVEFIEIDQKLQANEIAKKKILDSINTVVIGINQYL